MTKQSTEVAPEPQEAPKFDTTTPAQPTKIRRFTLNDLPRYQENLYPHLKRIFPHLHERMYGGWLRSCIQDNSAFFVCAEATVALAQIIHDPLDPRPVVDIVFCLGDYKEYRGIVDEIMRWTKDIGAREARYVSDNHQSFVRSTGRNDRTESRTMTVFRVD